MPSKIRIWKWLALSFWIILGVGGLTLLVAAIQSKNIRTCKNVLVEIKGGQKKFFIDEKEVMNLLAANQPVTFKGKPLREFDLKKLEGILETNAWIENAELYFDNQQALHIKVQEKIPVARIFTLNGNSFYVSNKQEKLPLSDKFSARLPVFTNFPSEKNKWRGKDSILMEQVKAISAYIQQEPFWMAQIEQVDILPDKTFVMIPKVGNHEIHFGDGENIPAKFNRLMVFYKEVLSKTGWNTYTSVNIQYKGQVVAVRRDAKTIKADTARTHTWIKKIFNNTQQEVLDDTLNRARQNSGAFKPLIENNPDTHSMKMSASKTNPFPGKLNNEPGTKGSVSAEKPKPKALMPEVKNW